MQEMALKYLHKGIIIIIPFPSQTQGRGREGVVPAKEDREGQEAENISISPTWATCSLSPCEFHHLQDFMDSQTETSVLDCGKDLVLGLRSYDIKVISFTVYEACDCGQVT